MNLMPKLMVTALIVTINGILKLKLARMTGKWLLPLILLMELIKQILSGMSVTRIKKSAVAA